jgi:hypothetical protein
MSNLSKKSNNKNSSRTRLENKKIKGPVGDYFVDKSLRDRANTTMSSFTPMDKNFTKAGKELTNQELAKRIMNLTAMKTF